MKGKPRQGDDRIELLGVGINLSFASDAMEYAQMEIAKAMGMPMTKKKKITDSELARQQNVCRQAIGLRRRTGWTEEEIQKGRRDQPRVRSYQTKISRDLGMSVREYAKRHGMSREDVYRLYRKGELKIST